MENKDLKSIFMDSFSGLDEKLVKETEQAPRLLRKRRDGAVLIAFVCSLALILGITITAGQRRPAPDPVVKEESASQPEFARENTEESTESSFKIVDLAAMYEQQQLFKTAEWITQRVAPQAPYGQFAEKLFAAWLGEAGNRALSPYSIYDFLSMLAYCSSDDAKAELLEVLGCQNLAELTGVTDSILRFLALPNKYGEILHAGHSLWLKEGTDFDEKKVSAIRDAFDTEIYRVDFTAPETAGQVDSWILEKTDRMIQTNHADRFAEDGDQYTALLLQSLYYQGNFISNKECGFIDFHKDGAVKNVPSVGIWEIVPCFDDGQLLAVQINVGEVGTLSLLMPKEGHTLSELDPVRAYELLCGQGDFILCDADVRVPLFDVATQKGLDDLLKELGIERALEPGAIAALYRNPGSELAEKSYVQVDHGSRVILNEDGIRAAAYTEGTSYGCWPDFRERTVLSFDRPFLFMISLGDGCPLFWGQIDCP